MCSMCRFPERLLKETAKVWQQYTPEHLSSRDAQEIAENMTNLVSLLLEWDGKVGNEGKLCCQKRTRMKEKTLRKRRENERTSLLDMQEGTRGGR